MRLFLVMVLTLFLCSFEYANFEKADGVCMLSACDLNLLRKYNNEWPIRLILAQLSSDGANHYASYELGDRPGRMPIKILDSGVNAKGRRWVKIEEFHSGGIKTIDELAPEFKTIRRSERSRELFKSLQMSVCPVQPFEKPIYDFVLHGQRTLYMQQALSDAHPQEFDAKREIFYYQKNGVTKPLQVATLATSDFTRPLVSIGGTGVQASDREFIILDAADSPHLQAKWKELLTFLKTEAKPQQTLPQTLQQIVDFMNTSVFQDSHAADVNQVISDFSSQHRNERFSFAHRRDGQNGPPLIPIDHFLAAHEGRGVGVCRHHGLVLSYFLQRLAAETNFLPAGDVFHIRDNIDLRGAHVWTAFAPKNSTELWHVDSLWNQIGNYNDPAVLGELADFYGQNLLKIKQRLGRP